MLNEQLIDKVIERLINRIEEGNSYVLKKMGESIKKIGTLSPSKAQQLVQILKYGGDYDKIVKKLAEITELNVKDIDKIFNEVAKNDYNFSKKFYEYRNIKFIPYEENEALKKQVKALSNITAGEYRNITRNLAFAKQVNGKIVYTDLSRTYQDMLDKAVLSVSQGKTTFQEEMYSTIKELASSGIKTIDYASGRSMRLDSAIRMHMKGALRNLHNEMQEELGKEFDSDGVEISVHMNPAPDHAYVQGKQFSNEEFDKFQNDTDAESYDGKLFPAESAETGRDRRSISEYNCYHYIFSIVLGVSKPEYSNEELQKIIDDNNEGFELDGKHYTNYEGTQLQRHLETEIRKQKDIQIMAKAGGNDFLAGEAQNKITVLTRKYKELSDASGLPTKLDRMRVSDYKRNSNATKTYQNEINKHKVGVFDITKYTNEIKPTTNDVVFMPDRIEKNNFKHPDAKVYYDKISEILNNPDQVYKEMGKHNNTIWLLKEIEGKKVETIIKINSTSLYQKKELGYKNSIIHIHKTRDNYIKNKEQKGDLKLLFDIKRKK